MRKKLYKISFKLTYYAIKRFFRSDKTEKRILYKGMNETFNKIKKKNTETNKRIQEEKRRRFLCQQLILQMQERTFIIWWSP